MTSSCQQPLQQLRSGLYTCPWKAAFYTGLCSALLIFFAAVGSYKSGARLDGPRFCADGCREGGGAKSVADEAAAAAAAAAATTTTTLMSSSSEQQATVLSTFFKEREQIYNYRRLRLAQFCQKHFGPYPSESRHLAALDRHVFWLGEFHLSYCANAKTGTTTWMRHFLHVSHVGPTLSGQFEAEANLHAQMRKLFNLPAGLTREQKQAIFDYSLSVTFVRHPFVRLVSMFQDKIVDRPLGWWRKTTPKNFTLVPYSSEDRPNPGCPTFVEFVSHLLKGGYRNDTHTETFWHKCDMCHLTYDVIGKLETAAEDMAYVLAKTGLGRALEDDDESPTPAGGVQHASSGGPTNVRAKKYFAALEKSPPSAEVQHASSGGPTDDLAKKYFATLERSQAGKLREMYRADFDLFGYDPEPLLRLARD